VVLKKLQKEMRCKPRGYWGEDKRN